MGTLCMGWDVYIPSGGLGCIVTLWRDWGLLDDL